jgi:hypothetical protein
MAKVFLDNTHYKVNIGNSVALVPNCYFMDFSEEPDTFLWSIGSITSNFSNSASETSTITSSALTPFDQKHFSIKIDNISDGEVVWVPVSLTASKDAESASITMTCSVARGTPRTCSVLVKMVTDGRLGAIDIVEDTIENQIEDVMCGIHDGKRIYGETVGQDLTPSIGELIENGAQMTQIGLHGAPESLYVENKMGEMTPDEQTQLHNLSRLKNPGFNGLEPSPNANESENKDFHFEGRSMHTIRTRHPEQMRIDNDFTAQFYMPYPVPGNGGCTSCTETTTERITWTTETECESVEHYKDITTTEYGPCNES